MRYSHIFVIMSILKADYQSNDWECWEGHEVCYNVSDDDNMNFYEAKSYCEQRESNLVSIESEDENWFVGSICGSQSCWIGLVENYEGTWSWLDENHSSYRN